MGQNNRAKQKLAAKMLLDGIGKEKICKELKIRESTLTRWRIAPSFLARLESLKVEKQQHIELQRLHLTQYALHTATYELSRWRGDSPNALAQVVACLKALKADFQSSANLLEPAETCAPTAESGTEAAPNLAEPAAFSFILNIKTL